MSKEREDRTRDGDDRRNIEADRKDQQRSEGSEHPNPYNQHEPDQDPRPLDTLDMDNER